MSRELDAKCALCRREGEKLFLKGSRCYTSKCAIVRRNYAPGMHGVKSQGRSSDFGLQLRAKQKAKRLYHLQERQMSLYFEKAIHSKEDTGYALIKLLEMRLDNVVHRIGYTVSRLQARQLVSHKYILVNNKTVNIPSYQVKPGDIISLKPLKKNKKLYQELLKQKEKQAQDNMVSWIIYDKDNAQAKIVSYPAQQDFSENIDDKLIVEFYSR